MTLAEELLVRARAARVLIAAAESCTAGLVAGAITAPAGASDIFDRGFVTYSNAAKSDMLGVDRGTVATCGAVSEEVARAMAQGALNRSDATLAIAITGIAGPGGTENKPEGRVCFGLARTGEETLSQTVEFGPLGRSEVRRATVEHALRYLLSGLPGP